MRKTLSDWQSDTTVDAHEQENDEISADCSSGIDDTNTSDSCDISDCENKLLQEEELDSQQGVIDFSLYLRSKREMGDDTSSLRSDQESEADSNMSTVLDQKNYIEELNRHLKLVIPCRETSK